jgi:hypothetical protein
LAQEIDVMLRWLAAAAVLAAVVYFSGILDGGRLGPGLMLLPLSAAVAYTLYSGRFSG